MRRWDGLVWVDLLSNGVAAWGGVLGFLVGGFDGDVFERLRGLVLAMRMSRLCVDGFCVGASTVEVAGELNDRRVYDFDRDAAVVFHCGPTLGLSRVLIIARVAEVYVENTVPSGGVSLMI